jgi:VWFA-related protein
MLNSITRPWFVRPLWCALWVLGILVCTSWAPRASSQGEPAQTNRVSLRVDVELVTVEVIVLDKKRHPIPNLKKEDFQLFEDGKRQEIVTFAEISDEQSREVPTSLADLDEGAPSRGKVVLILFDDSHITSPRLHDSRESAEKYVKEQMRPMDLFAVASYGLSLKLLQNFTHDAAKVTEAIRRPALSSANEVADARGLGTAMPGQNPMEQESMNRSRVSVASPEIGLRILNLFRALNALSSSVAAVRGRKTVILFSEDFSTTPEVQTELTNTINFARRANVAFYTVDVRGLNVGPTVWIPARRGRSDADALRTAFSPVSSISGRLSSTMVLPGTGTQNLSAFSFGGQSGQTGGGQTGGGGGSGSSGGSGTGSGAGGAGGGSSGSGSTGGSGTGSGTGSSGSGSGGNTPGGNTTGNTTRSNTNPTTPDLNSPNRDVLDLNRDQQEFGRFSQQTIENILRSLATETGGVAIYNTSDFNGRLNEVTRELNNYYVLGFQSNNPKRDGAYRRLKVKTEVKAEVRYRDGYVDPRPLDVLAGSKGERSMLSAIASPTPAVTLPVTFNAAYFFDAPGLARIPVTARIATPALALKNKGGQLAGDLNVMGVAYGEDGGVSARFSETLHVAIDKDKEAAFRQKPIDYHNYFKLRPGKYQLKIAAADEKGKVGSAEQVLVVPSRNPDELAGSSLVLVQQLSQLPALIQDLQVKLLDSNDPLIYKGFQVTPSVENQVPVGKPVKVVFKLYNLSDNAPERNLVAEARLTDQKGGIQVLPPIPLEPYLFPTGRNEAMFGLGLPFAEVAPGKYTLAITTSEGGTRRSVLLQADVEVR